MLTQKVERIQKRNVRIGSLVKRFSLETLSYRAAVSVKDLRRIVMQRDSFGHERNWIVFDARIDPFVALVVRQMDLLNRVIFRGCRLCRTENLGSCR